MTLASGLQDARPRREVQRDFPGDETRTLAGGNSERRGEAPNDEHALEAIVVGVMA